MKVKIADLNGQLIFKLSRAGYDAVKQDYLDAARDTDNPVFVTASNPKWTFGGGLDYYVFALNFPDLVAEKQAKGGDMERIENICFCITVDHAYRSSPEIIETALRFAKEHTKEHETLLLSGIGTGIGGLSVDEFVETFKRVFPLP